MQLGARAAAADRWVGAVIMMVGVTAQQTPGAVSTVVITKAADPKQGFAELDRLLNLARQK